MSRPLPDLDVLLAPVSEASPCGPELDYDADFIALENLMLGSPERQYGDTIIAAEGPDFSQVLAQACSLLARSKDLRLAVMATRGLARTAGVAGARHGLCLVQALVQNYWDDVHPALTVDGEYDPLPRGNALSLLGASEGLLGDLRSTRIRTRLMGAIELAEIERAVSGRESETLSRAQATQLLQDEALGDNQDLHQLDQLRSVTIELDQLLRNGLGVECAPDFKPLLGLLDALRVQSVTASDSSGVDDGQSPADGLAPTTGGLPALRTRQDAIQLLEAVCAFLERHEPANPAPLLIRRARGLIGQDFLTILRELAPDGVAQAEHLAGMRQ